MNGRRCWAKSLTASVAFRPAVNTRAMAGAPDLTDATNRATHASSPLRLFDQSRRYNEIVATIIRACPSCGRGNRVKGADLAKQIRCGACKTTLGPVDHPIDADAELFSDIIRHVKVPVLVDFWAAWCGPCRMAAPEVSRVAKEMAGRAVVLKVDTDRQQALAGQYGVRGIPNFIVFKSGQVILQQAGVVGAEQMKAWLDQSRTQPI